MVSVAARKLQVAYARKRGISCRSACSLLRVARSGLRYESKLQNRQCRSSYLHPRARHAVPALWLSSHPNPRSPQGPLDELWQDVPIVALCRSAGAAQTPASAR